MTPLPGPIVLLALPLIAGGATYLVRRWSILSSLLAAATTSALAYLCLRLPLDRSGFIMGQEVAFGRPVVIVGRTLVLEAGGQMWLAFIFVVATILFLLAWRLPQGRSFIPSSLAVLSLYALIALLQTFSLAVLTLAISTALVIFILPGESRSIQGALRYLVVTLLAVPFLLTAAWFVDQSILSPENAQMARQALVPAAVGFGLLLAAFPFGTWMPTMSADAPPIATAFVFITGQAMALYLAMIFVQATPFRLSEPGISDAVRLTGLVMAVSGGVMAAVQRDFGRLFGYAALSDLGFLLLAFPAGGSQGLSLALLHFTNRAVSITLMATSLAIIRHRTNSDCFGKLRGTARRLPIATLGMLLGGFGLAGFPFTPGFPSRWAISRAVWNWAQPLGALAREATLANDAIAIQQWAWALAFVALIGSSVGILVGLLRGLNAMLGSDTRDEVTRQPIVANLMVLALVALAIVLSLNPRLFFEPVHNAAQAFSLF
jgi:multicomponent Na+:H+ antiporter subunit D